MYSTIEETNKPSAAAIYSKRGWCPLPLPAGEKHPPPSGTTGNVNAITIEDIRKLWEHGQDNRNVGLRLQPSGDADVIALDVDHYEKKKGADTRRELEEELGELPDTYRSSRRGADDKGGQLFFRVPAGVKWKSSAGADIDVVQMTHRYSAVWPSVVDGQQYRWYDAAGTETEVPAVDDLPELPESWTEFLRKGELSLKNAPDLDMSVDEGNEWLESVAPDYSGELGAIFKTVLDDDAGELADEFAGNGHDTMKDKQWNFLKLAILEGQPGLKKALETLERLFIDGVADRRGERAARREFASALVTGINALRGQVQKRHIVPFKVKYSSPELLEGITELAGAKKAAEAHAELKRVLFDAVVYEGTAPGAAVCFTVSYPHLSTLVANGEVELYDRANNGKVDEVELDGAWSDLVSIVRPLVLSELADRLERDPDLDEARVRSQLEKFSTYCNKERQSWKGTMSKVAAAMRKRGRELTEMNINADPEVLGIDADYVFDLALATEDMTSALQCVRPRTWEDLTTQRLDFDVAAARELDPEGNRLIDQYRAVAIPDDGVFAGLFEVYGYSLSGNNDLGISPGSLGPGGSGKSEFTRLFTALNPGGDDKAEEGYFATLTPRDFTNEASANPQKRVLVNRRIVFLTEFQAGQSFPDDALKRQNGGGGDVVRDLHSKRLESTKGCTVSFETNAAPATSVDTGLSRRLRVIPFRQAAPEWYPVADFLGEAPAGWRRTVETQDRLLTWLAQGYARFRRKKNLKMEELAPAIQAATQAFMDSADPFREFFLAHFDVTGDGGDWVSTDEIVSAFMTDQQDSITKEVAGKKVNSLALAGIDAYRKKVNGKKIAGFKGVRLIAQEQRSENTDNVINMPNVSAEDIKGAL